MVPRLTRVVFVFNPNISRYSDAYVQTAQAAAPSLALEVSTAPTHGDGDVEAVIAGLAKNPSIGLIFLPDVFAVVHHQQIVDLVTKERVPPSILFAFSQKRAA